MSPHWKARFRGACWIVSFAVVATLASGVLRGESDVESAEAPQEKLVMLSSGRILSGRISRNSGGYLVEQPSGRVQLMVDEVQFVADDVRGLYRKQRDSVVHPTPSSHIALANWCVSHRLHDEARDELRLCLKADPANDEARRLLSRLTDTIRAGLPSPSVSPILRKTSDGFLQPDVESLGGLSRESAIQFTSRIQPLLLNKCGNASCHGTASSNGFRLISARVGGNASRQNSERNLSETMRYVDLDDVANSQLLSVTTTAHGNKGTIFVGPAGNEQIKLLRNWARSVAEEKQAELQGMEMRTNFVGKKQPKTPSPRSAEFGSPSKKARGFASRDTERNLPSGAEMSASRPETDPESSELDPKSDLNGIEASRDLKPFDTFDPEIFNRQPRRR